MANTDIEILGLKELQKSLELIGQKVGAKAEKSISMKSLKAGSKVILVEAKRRVPVGKYGRLKRSLGIKPTKGRLEMQIGARRGKKRDDRRGAWYAHLVEFGTRLMRAQPFLRPAVDAKSNEAVVAVGVELFKLIEQESKR